MHTLKNQILLPSVSIAILLGVSNGAHADPSPTPSSKLQIVHTPQKNAKKSSAPTPEERKKAEQARHKILLQYLTKERQRRWNYEDEVRNERRAYEDEKMRFRREWDLKMDAALTSDEPQKTHDALAKQKTEAEKEWQKKDTAFRKKLDDQQKALDADLKKLRQEAQTAAQP